MKLTYRGVSYEYNPPHIEVAEDKVVGKYRGLDWRFRNLKKPPILQPSVQLTYRGVTYNKNPMAVAASATEVTTPETAVTSVSEQARSLMMNHDRTVKKRQQTMLSRLAAEVGLDHDNSHYNHA